MARPGYLETRKAYYEAQEDLLKDEASLNRLKTCPPDHLIGYVLEQEIKRYADAVERSKIAVEKTKAVFDAFNVDSKPERKYFETKVNVCLSLTHDMQFAISERRAKDGMSFAELIRRALTIYLQETDSDRENKE